MSTELLFEKVMTALTMDIDFGTYKVGEKLPNEAELCERFGVSRITVRRAVEELVRNGVLLKKQGKGTFVRSPMPDIRQKELMSFHESMRKQGKKVRTKALSVRFLAADEKDAAELSVAEGQKVLEILRLHTVDGIPAVLEKNHFSAAYSYLMECDLDGSLYHVLAEFGVEPSTASHEISLRRADQAAAGRLSVPEGTPLIFLSEVIYDQKGRPLHNSRQLIRGDILTYRI